MTGGADGVGRDAGVGAAVGGDHVADVDVADDVVVHGHVLPDKVPAVRQTQRESGWQFNSIKTLFGRLSESPFEAGSILHSS